MPLTRRQLQANREFSAILIREAEAAVERAREVCQQLRNDAQRRANRRALDKARARK